MPKRYSSRRRYSGRRRSYKKKSTARKFGSRQQHQASTYVRKRYTKVFTLEARLNGTVAEQTVSLIGAKNLSEPNSTVTLFSVNQDN